MVCLWYLPKEMGLGSGRNKDRTLAYRFCGLVPISRHVGIHSIKAISAVDAYQQPSVLVVLEVSELELACRWLTDRRG